MSDKTLRIAKVTIKGDLRDGWSLVMHDAGQDEVVKFSDDQGNERNVFFERQELVDELTDNGMTVRADGTVEVTGTVTLLRDQSHLQN